MNKHFESSSVVSSATSDGDKRFYQQQQQQSRHIHKTHPHQRHRHQHRVAAPAARAASPDSAAVHSSSDIADCNRGAKVDRENCKATHHRADPSSKITGLYSPMSTSGGLRTQSHVKETVDRGVGPTPVPQGLHHLPASAADLKSFLGFPPFLPDPRNNNFIDPNFGYQPFLYGHHPPHHVTYGPFNQPLPVNSSTNEGRYQWPPTAVPATGAASREHTSSSSNRLGSPSLPSNVSSAASPLLANNGLLAAAAMAAAAVPPSVPSHHAPPPGTGPGRSTSAITADRDRIGGGSGDSGPGAAVPDPAAAAVAAAAAAVTRLNWERYQRAAAALRYSPYGLPPPPASALGQTVAALTGASGYPDYLSLGAYMPLSSLPNQHSLLSGADQLPMSVNSSRGFGSPRTSLLCKGTAGVSRKRALSHSPLDLGLDIESLTRSSEGSLHLPSLSGGRSTPPGVGCSSGSYGHLSAASFNALSPAHSTLSHPLFRHGLLPPSPFLGTAALHAGMFPWPPPPHPVNGHGSLQPTLPSPSPGSRTSGSKSDSQTMSDSNVAGEQSSGGASTGIVSSTVDHHNNDRDSTGPPGSFNGNSGRRAFLMTRIKTEEYSPQSDVISDDCHQSSACDEQQDANFLPHEGEPDFYETNCHWDGCRAEFDTQEELVRHLLQEHVSASRKHFVCLWDGCGRAGKPFKAQYMLVVHMRRHTGEKPHRCTFEGCSKAYSRLENLKTHLRSHTGEKPYLCEFPGCAKAFSNASDRAKHQNRTHSNAKPYVCKAYGCTKCYTDPSSLRKHIKTVHGPDFYAASKKHRGDSYGDDSGGNGQVNGNISRYYGTDMNDHGKIDLANGNSNSSGMGSNSSSSNSPADRPASDGHRNHAADHNDEQTEVRRPPHVSSRSTTTRRQQRCSVITGVETSILSGGEFIITSSVDEQSDVENILNDIVLPDGSVGIDDSLLVAPAAVSRPRFNRFQSSHPKARAIVPNLPPLGNTRRAWPSANLRRTNGSLDSNTSDVSRMGNKTNVRHISDTSNNGETLSTYRFRRDSSTSSAIGSSCLSATSSFCSVRSAPHNDRTQSGNMSSSVAASPYEYDMATGQSIESVGGVHIANSDQRLYGRSTSSYLANSVASESDASSSCRFLGRGGVSRYLAARRRESSDSGLLTDSSDFRRASDPVLNDSANTAGSPAAADTASISSYSSPHYQRCHSAGSMPPVPLTRYRPVKASPSSCSSRMNLMSSRSSIATNISGVSDDLIDTKSAGDSAFSPASAAVCSPASAPAADCFSPAAAAAAAAAAPMNIADSVVGDLIIPDEMRDFINATYSAANPGSESTLPSADSTVADSPAAAAVAAPSIAHGAILSPPTSDPLMADADAVRSSCMYEKSPKRDPLKPVADKSEAIYQQQQQHQSAGLPVAAASGETVQSPAYSQPQSCSFEPCNEGRQIQVSQISQSLRSGPPHLSNNNSSSSRTGPHNVGYRQQDQATVQDPLSNPHIPTPGGGPISPVYSGQQYLPYGAPDELAVRFRRNPHQMNWWLRNYGYYNQFQHAPPHATGPSMYRPDGDAVGRSAPGFGHSPASLQQASPNCNQVTSSTDCQQNHRGMSSVPQPVNNAVYDDDRLSSALNSICMADGEIGFLDSLSSLSMESSTNPAALSPTALVAAAASVSVPPGCPTTAAAAAYYSGATSNMVVNDMGSALSQLHAEETNYFMTIHA